MINAGIHCGDLLIIDKSANAVNNSIILAILNGGFTVKRLELSPTGPILHPENPSYPPIVITQEMEFSVWGVVTTVIHSLNGRKI